MVINNLNKRIYTIYKALQEESEYIDDNICYIFITRERFNKIKHNEDAISIIKTYISSFLTDGKSYNPKMNLIKTDFSKYEEYLQSTFIFNESFEIMIKEFDSTTTFFI